MAVAAQRHEARLVAAQQRLEALATAVESCVEKISRRWRGAPEI